MLEDHYWKTGFSRPSFRAFHDQKMVVVESPVVKNRGFLRPTLGVVKNKFSRPPFGNGGREKDYSRPPFPNGGRE